MTRFVFSAWGVSVGLHLVALALLAGSMQYWSGGSGDGGNHSLSIVLSHSGDDGDLRNGDNGEGEQLRNLPTPEPPPLLAVATYPMPAPAADDRRVTQVSTATPATNGAVASNHSRPNTGQAATGTGRSSSPGGSGQAKVSVFGVEGHGSKFLYLFDRSASMEGAQLTAAKRQLLESMHSLNNVHQFHIIFFNTKTQAFDDGGGPHRNAFATEQNKQLAANFVGGITADGGTDRMIALRTAVGCAPDVIFFLTDADDPMSESELAEIERMNQRFHAAICVIEFGRNAAPEQDNFLMRLARDTGGRYGYVNTATLRR
jgi:hypothetical protein